MNKHSHVSSENGVLLLYKGNNHKHIFNLHEEVEHERNEFFRPNYRFYRNFGFVSNESEVIFSKSGFGLTEAEIGFQNSAKNEFLTNF